MGPDEPLQVQTHGTLPRVDKTADKICPPRKALGNSTCLQRLPSNGAQGCQCTFAGGFMTDDWKWVCSPKIHAGLLEH